MLATSGADVEYIAIEDGLDGTATLVTRLAGTHDEIRSIQEMRTAMIAAHYMLRPEWFWLPTTRC